jgi:hypothetical protein
MFESDRTFRLWDTIISQQRLLLRSPKSEKIQRNLDVMFFGIKYLQIPTSFEGIKIDTPNQEQLMEVRQFYLESFGDDELQVIFSKGKSFYIVSYGYVAKETEFDLFQSELRPDATPFGY